MQDPEHLENLVQREKILEQNLQKLETRRALLGLSAPLSLENEIEYTKDELAKVCDEIAQLTGTRDQAQDSTPDSQAREQLQASPTSRRGFIRPRANAHGLIDASDVNKIYRVYVPPVQYDRTRDRLADQHVVVLIGERETGKFATAINLLHERSPRGIAEYSPNEDLTKPHRLGIEQGRGYIVDSITAQSTSTLSAAVLRGLKDTLKAQQSYLIITAHTQIIPDREALREFIVEWQPIVDRPQVLRKHLQFHVPDPAYANDIDMLCQQPKVLAILPRLTLARIGEFAQVLATVILRKNLLEQAIEPFDEQVEQLVKDWFASHTTLEERTRMIAMAVFHGGHYQAAMKADHRLRELINPSPVDVDVPQPHFDVTRSQLLAPLEVEVRRMPTRTHFGMGSVELVELSNSARSSAILKFAWNEFANSRELILEWLRQLSLTTDQVISVHALGTLTELSRQDFDTLYARIVRPWGVSLKRRERETAALIIERIFSEGGYESEVINLLNDWSRPSANWQLRWTAAFVYGKVGRSYLQEALDNLRSIGESGDQRLSGVVAVSVAALFEYGKEKRDFYISILEKIESWTADPTSKAAKNVGLPAFVQIAEEAYLEHNNVRWPALLWFFGVPQQSARLRTLWSRALNSGIAPIRDRALAVLRKWLIAAEITPEFKPYLKGLFRNLFHTGDARERERLRYYLERWATDRKQPSALADAILRSPPYTP